MQIRRSSRPVSGPVRSGPGYRSDGRGEQESPTGAAPRQRCPAQSCGSAGDGAMAGHQVIVADARLSDDKPSSVFVQDGLLPSAFSQRGFAAGLDERPPRWRACIHALVQSDFRQNAVIRRSESKTDRHKQ